jgi:hypothetical protein
MKCVSILIIPFYEGKNHTNIPLIRLQEYLNAPSFRYLLAGGLVPSNPLLSYLEFRTKRLRGEVEGCNKDPDTKFDHPSFVARVFIFCSTHKKNGQCWPFYKNSG